MERLRHLEQMIEFPKEGILSKTIYEGAFGEADLFMLPKGEKISAHTSSRDAGVLALRGECEFTLGDEKHRVKAGDWLMMEAGLLHALQALDDFVFVLVLFGGD